MKECKKCGGEMKPSIALVNTLAGIPDFPGDNYACTVSATGPPAMVDCLKCGSCGYSISWPREESSVEEK